MKIPVDKSRFRGSLLGLAVGDALGTTQAEKPPGSFAPIHDMIGGGPYGLLPGQWTDDTSMALCLAESLLETGQFDPADQMRRYVRWYREGYLSSTGSCFDIGFTVHAALERFLADGNAMAGSTDPKTAGNGSLMRLAPVPLRFAADPVSAIRLAGESSRTTHGTVEAVDACRYFAGLLVGAVLGAAKEVLLSPMFTPAAGLWEEFPLCPGIRAIAEGSFLRKNPPQIRGTGYVVETLEAALWAFARSRDFREGALLAVNLGNDADTTGAIYGQIAGAFYGEEGIPVEWRNRVAMRNVIIGFADRLAAMTAAS